MLRIDRAFEMRQLHVRTIHLRDGGRQRATNNMIPASLKSTDVCSEEALVTMEIERLHRKRAEGFLSSKCWQCFIKETFGSNRI